MNEPSPEATQAAVDWDKARNKDVDDFPTIMEAFAAGYDTATAKAREELELIKKHWPAVQAVIRSDITVGEGIESVVAITEALQLAHQQPSADFRQPDETRHPGYGSDFRAKPIPPTADVEKIAREARDAALLEQLEHTRANPHPVGYHVQQALTQARAPLVEALQEWQRLDNIKGLDPSLRRTMKTHARNITRAALCGKALPLSN